MINLIQQHNLEKHVSHIDLQDYNIKKLVEVRKALYDLKQEKDNLLPFEKLLSNKLEDHLEKKEYKLKIKSEIPEISEIDLSFLSKTKDFKIRDDSRNVNISLNLPIFATYDKNNSFEISVSFFKALGDVNSKFGKTLNSFNQSLPYSINKNYKDFIEKPFSYEEKLNLADFRGNNTSTGFFLTLESKFHGLVPNEIKQKLISTKEYFEEDIYLIAEADYSSIKIERDPLIIGFDKKYGEPYLLACFDCTPLENYVAGEFSLNKSGQN